MDRPAPDSYGDIQRSYEDNYCDPHYLYFHDHKLVGVGNLWTGVEFIWQK